MSVAAPTLSGRSAPRASFRWRVVQRLDGGSPYVLLVFLLAALATCVITALAVGWIEDGYRAEFAVAGRTTSDAIVRIEAEQSAALRQMAHAAGVADAFQKRDAASLRAIVDPVARSSGIPYAAAFGPDGAALVVYETAGEPSLLWRVGVPGTMESSGLGQRDDRVIAVASSAVGPLLVSTASVATADGTAGTLLLGRPLREVVNYLGRDLGGKSVSLYDPSGVLLASTLGGARSEGTDILRLRQSATAGGPSVRHVFRDERPFIEVVGAVPMRGQLPLWLGVGKLSTAVEEAAHQTRNLMLPLLGLMVLVLVMIGALSASRLYPMLEGVIEMVARIRHNDLGLAFMSHGSGSGLLTRAFNEMAGGLQERERARHAIERYLSPKLYQMIQNGELRIGGESREITVLMTDIRDFTSLAETMPPDALLDLLNRYFEAMFEPISQHDGEVDKYLGDGILAKFGATEWYPDHAQRAVLAAIDMLAACEQLNMQLRREGQSPLRMGVGANTGDAIVGNVGAARRMEYTIISDAVNTAERVGSLCKELEWDLLISHHTYAQASGALEVGEPLVVQLRGQTRDTEVYPVLGRRGAVPPSRRRRYYQLLAQRETAERRAQRPLAITRHSSVRAE